MTSSTRCFDWQESDVLGAMAGWQKCVRCGHFVEPWNLGHPAGVTRIHQTCWLVRESHWNVDMREWPHLFVLKMIEGDL
jgi:hypothetical protein